MDGAMRATPREQIALELLSRGCDFRQISLVLANKEQSVKNLFYNLRDKFEAECNEHLIAIAFRNGILK